MLCEHGVTSHVANNLIAITIDASWVRAARQPFAYNILKSGTLMSDKIVTKLIDLQAPKIVPKPAHCQRFS